ncbi:MAG: ABC transporter permease [Anaerolineaceae bacterium]
MNIFKHILNIAWKDFQILIRDRGLLAVIIAMPLLFGLLLSSAYSGSYNENAGSGLVIPIIIVNEDPGTFGQRVVDILKQIEELKITEIAETNAKELANQAVLSGDQSVALIIPNEFSRQIEDYSGSEINMIVDPQKKDYGVILKGILDSALAPVIVEGEIRYGIQSVMKNSGMSDIMTSEMEVATEAQTMGVVMTQLQTQLADPLITVNLVSSARDPKMPINFFNLLMPGFTVMFSFFLVGSVGESIFRERDDGTFRRLLAGPIPRAAIIAGKMLAFAALILVQVGLLFGIAAGFFSMDLGSNPLGLILITVCLSMVVTSLGLMVASLAKSGKQADSISTLLAFVLAGLGGCIQFGLTPLFLQENAIATLSRFIPQGQALWGYYKLINQNATLVNILPQAGILLGMALVFFLIATWRLKWEPA